MDDDSTSNDDVPLGAVLSQMFDSTNVDIDPVDAVREIREDI